MDLQNNKIMKILHKNVNIVNEGQNRWRFIQNGIIEYIGIRRKKTINDALIIDGTVSIFSRIIDGQVHFREPD
jgi:dihydroorotase-like cyclic amidohydrolase